jgi:hypothetical protein
VPTTLTLTNLLLDVINPRFETEQQNQRDAITRMAVEQGDKILNLAEDIVQFGMDPSSLPLVIATQDGDKHIVLEGNRRIVALKLLHNPTLAPEAWTSVQERRLKELSQQFKKAPISTVHCILLAGREEADHWIQLRHRGQQDGRGIVSWDGHAIARYEQRRGGGRTRAALQAIDLVKEKGGLDEDTLGRLNNVPVTTVQRLLNDPDVRKSLGLTLNKGALEATLPEREVLKGLTRIVRAAAHGQLPVSAVEKKEDRAAYIKRFPSSDLPSATAPQTSSYPIGSGTPVSTAIKPIRPIPPSTARRILIPQPCKIVIAETKSNNIYHELRKIHLEEYPFAISVLFRVFLELSIDHYIIKQKLKTPAELDQMTMRSKLEAAAANLQNKGGMTKKQANLLRNFGNPQKFLAASIDNFHGYVHDAHFSAGPSDLIAAWDSLEPFFKKFWE